MTIHAWDTAGKMAEVKGFINVPDRIESCNEYKPDAIAFCNWSTTNEVPGATYHLAAKARRPLSTPTIKTMAVLVDGKEQMRIYSNYVDTDLKLTPGTHTIVVQALDSNNQMIQGTRTVTIQ
jgi:hypothetical protein